MKSQTLNGIIKVICILLIVFGLFYLSLFLNISSLK